MRGAIKSVLWGARPCQLPLGFASFKFRRRQRIGCGDRYVGSGIGIYEMDHLAHQCNVDPVAQPLKHTCFCRCYESAAHTRRAQGASEFTAEDIEGFVFVARTVMTMIANAVGLLSCRIFCRDIRKPHRIGRMIVDEITALFVFIAGKERHLGMQNANHIRRHPHGDPGEVKTFDELMNGEHALRGGRFCQGICMRDHRGEGPDAEEAEKQHDDEDAQPAGPGVGEAALEELFLLRGK